ncbi:malonyl-CoA decarboxylase [Haematospirillum jordaniae]|uniref:malonyl-CoA decarboxylase n=1 Tax=Haematospirillum jordaniae TaxID=1549855 RepID=UPI001432FF02|nr:malonyl-CoA decarboxylase [Haematospirillum jordaniae]NKD84803.1 malonyl-CoA decarboxylase [Haematospirillum jordaniae]
MARHQVPGLLDRLGTLWREFVAPQGGSALAHLDPDLPDEQLLHLREQMQACLDARGGDVSARTRAAALGHVYLGLSELGRRRFLTLMATEFSPDRDVVDRAIAELEAADDAEREQAAFQVYQALQPPRINLLKQFNILPDGVKFLVDMRAELLKFRSGHPELDGLERDLMEILTGWFDIGFLELRRITWDSSPAAVLEKIISYEAVHEIRSWDDLKNRLDSDRRLYGFFHPRMPDEPLIFVQVALLNGIADNVHDLLDVNAPVGDPALADTAVFYSISNAQKGLSGISFGNFLIKKVVSTLSAEFPSLKAFATLSPLPGFRVWLEQQVEKDGDDLLLPAETKAVTALVRRKGNGARPPALGLFGRLLSAELWQSDKDTAEVMRPILLRLATIYLVSARRFPEKGNVPVAIDPVAHFHLSNGARIERLNWMGDRSERGIRQSAGLMVNYLYRLQDIEKNHEGYSSRGTAALSSALKGWLKG